MAYSADAFPKNARVCVLTQAIDPSWKPTPSFQNVWSYGTVSANRNGVLVVSLVGKSEPVEVSLDGTVTILNITMSEEETYPRQNGRK